MESSRARQTVQLQVEDAGELLAIAIMSGYVQLIAGVHRIAIRNAATYTSNALHYPRRRAPVNQATNAITTLVMMDVMFGRFIYAYPRFFDGFDQYHGSQLSIPDMFASRKK
jgi:hypothetical protein